MHQRFSPQAARRDISAVATRSQLRPDEIFGDIFAACEEKAEATIGAGDNPLAVTDSVDGFADTIGNHLGMFDVVRSRVDHARQQDEIHRQRVPAECCVSVLAVRIGKLETQRADARSVQHGESVLERHVVDVLFFPIPPTAMQPDAVAWDVCYGLVQAAM